MKKIKNKIINDYVFINDSNANKIKKDSLPN